MVGDFKQIFASEGMINSLVGISRKWQWLEYDQLLGAIKSDNVGAAIITGNYPSDWSTNPLIDAMKSCFT